MRGSRSGDSLEGAWGMAQKLEAITHRPLVSRKGSMKSDIPGLCIGSHLECCTDLDIYLRLLLQAEKHLGKGTSSSLL